MVLFVMLVALRLTTPHPAVPTAAQGKLMATVVHGILQTAGPDAGELAWKVGLALVAWLAGGVTAGIAAVYVGGRFLGWLFGRPVLGQWLGAYITLLLPLSVGAIGFWGATYAAWQLEMRGREIGPSLIMLLVGAAAVTTWVAAAYATIGWSTAVRHPGRKASPASCAITLCIRWFLGSSSRFERSMAPPPTRSPVVGTDDGS
jgi:hypothetical protein